MRKEEAKFETVFMSEIGTQNKNSDYFGYVQLDNYVIWAVADGFDGELGSDIAAKLAVTSAIEYFITRPRFNKEVIKEMMEYANLKVKEKQEETEKYSLMHTSLLIVISNYNSYMYGNIGNTRMYHLRGGYVISQSKDDTISQLLVDENALNEGDLKYHRQRNELLQAIGDFGKIKPYITKKAISLQENDMLCFSTMGFWENIDSREMEVEISRHENKLKLLKVLEHKIMANTRKDIENYTLALVSINKIASPEPLEKDKKKYWLKIGIISLIILSMLLSLIFWNKYERNKIVKRAVVYEEQANESIEKKDFNNALDELKLEKSELEKLKPKTKGIIGFFTGAKGKEADAEKRIKSVDEKISQTTKLQKAFLNIEEGNQLFNTGSYDEASVKYQEARYILEENNYKRDELNTDDILITLKSRIDSSSKLKEAQNVEKTGDNAYLSGNYNMAKESYKIASEIYLVNGRADYVSSIERKLSEINEKEKTEYSGAMVTENKGDILAPTDVNMSRQSYYQAREMYQNLGDSAKVQEIDSKINELNSRQLSNLQTANNLVQEGLNQITSNNPGEGVALLTKAKNIYQNLGDTNNVNNVNKFIAQAQEYIKYESENEQKLKEQEIEYTEKLKTQELKATEEITKRENIIKQRQDEILREKERREKIAQNIETATNLEIQADQMFLLKRYTESVSKYNESKKIFEELKQVGDFDDQTNKIEYLEQKIIKTEGYLYEEQGDKEYKDKNWKESEKKYQLSLENMKKSSETNEIQKRVEKKLKKAKEKANKKWWQFWK